MRILIAEDEKDLNRLLKKRLENQKYSVDACFDGQEALDYLEGAEYDALILDIMMPVMDGLTVLKKLRSRGNSVPVLLLTAKDSIEDRVNGLDAGANDYLVKPFAFEELLARIRVMIRRQSDSASDEMTLADLIVDAGKHLVTRGGKAVELSAKEFAVLEYLMRHQGQVLSREQIEQHVWDFDYEGGSNMVDVYIRYLRRKLDEGHEKKLIHTVRGAGYVMREQP